MLNHKSKLIQKCSALLLALIMMFSLTSNAIAKEEDHIEIKFNDFNYTLYGYNSDKVYVEQTERNGYEVAKIIDKESGELLEKVEKKPINSPGFKNNTFSTSSSPYGTKSAFIFTRTQKIGSAEIYLDVTVELYKSGSFSQINDVKNYYLGISNSIGTMSFEDKKVSVWPDNNKYPTAKLHYAYSGTLMSKVKKTYGGGVKAELLGAGFSLSDETESYLYYRKAFRNASVITTY